MKQIFDFKTVEEVKACLGKLPSLHDMVTCKETLTEKTLELEYSNGDTCLFEEYGYEKYKKVIVTFFFEDLDNQVVRVINRKKVKWYDLKDYIELLHEKDMHLVDYYYTIPSWWSRDIVFVYNTSSKKNRHDFDYEAEVRFDLTRLEYEWIEK